MIYAEDLNYWKTGTSALRRFRPQPCSITISKRKRLPQKSTRARVDFFQYLLLPDGRTAAQAAAPELTSLWPKLLTGE